MAYTILCGDIAQAQNISAALEDSASRIIHDFDFLEPENFDTVPRDWARFPDPQHPDPAFPRYTEAYFDTAVGHDAAPSFYLESKGRCIARRYDGPATRIRPGDYLVAGWVKLDRIQNSRAAISAYYLDWEGQYIDSTQAYSRLVGPRDGSNGWQQVQVYLPKSPQDAHFIGITCWVVQQDIWRGGITPHRHISHRDVLGGAWFDDIAVLGLPRAILESINPGNVFAQPERAKLLITVTDNEVGGLSGRLQVSDRHGKEVFHTAITAHRYDDETIERVVLPELKAGLYHAGLDIYSGDQHLLRRALKFAIVSESQRQRRYVATRMGMMFEGVAPGQSADELALVDMLRLGAVKLPLWTGDPTNPGFEVHRDELHELLDQMIQSRISVTGVLAGPPAAMVRTVGIHARSLLDILSEDARGWQDYLNAMVAPYASILSSWQIGGDGDASFIHDPRVPEALTSVRQVMQDMITAPLLTTVATAADWPGRQRIGAENLSVDLPPDIRPTHVDAHLKPYRDLAYDRLWVSVPLPPTRDVDQDAALADWALKIVEARWSGVDTVFVPQLWRTRSTLYGRLTEPSAAFVVYRTIIDAIGDAAPAHRLSLGSTGRALAFTDGDQAVLVMWDPSAPADGREHTLQLGAAREATDIWGNNVQLQRAADGRQRIRLSPAPVFVRGIEPWLVAFRAGLRLTPAHVNFAVEPRLQTITVPNPHRAALSGEIVLSAPPNWEIEPERFRFSLDSGETRPFSVKIRHPNNEPAGMKIVRAEVTLLSGNKYLLDVPLEFELGVHDLDVWGYAVMEGDSLVVQQGVTNRADEKLSFRGFAVYPGRSRQYRVINEILPGQTLSVEYRFRKVTDTSGRTIRLGLREVNGPRVHNLEVVAP